MSRFRFLLKTLTKYVASQPRSCPYCKSDQTTVLEWKNFLWQLRECQDCLLRFRFPKDDISESTSFYQGDYRQENVTDLPGEQEIPLHIRDNFRGVGRDLTTHLKVIQDAAPSGSILDYGCSWGYGVYQLDRAGYRAKGFEVSIPRVEYGRRTLGVDLTSDLNELSGCSFDAIYSAHVLEHTPDPAATLAAFHRLLVPGGKLFIYVPNAGGEHARRLGVKWGQLINEKHVLALTAEFFHRNLPSYGFTTHFSSSPYAEPPRPYEQEWDQSGEELLVVGTLKA